MYRMNQTSQVHPIYRDLQRYNHFIRRTLLVRRSQCLVHVISIYRIQ